MHTSLLCYSGFGGQRFALQVQKLDGIFEICFLCTMAIPVASIALIWKLFVLTARGWLMSILGSVWHPGCGFYEFRVLILGSGGAVIYGRTFGYDIVLCLAGLSSIPYNLYEAAK